MNRIIIACVVYSAILGGTNNRIKAQHASILGGQQNKIWIGANHSAILGGNGNQISDPYCLAFGNGVEINDPDDVGYITVFYNDVYPGKVGINIPVTAVPTAELEVNGTVKIQDVLQLVPRLDPPTVVPGPDYEGLIYYNSADHMLYFYDGTDWRPCWEP